MKIGCVKEIKKHEYRVGITPDNAHEYIVHGHSVVIETGAGEGAGFTDAEYRDAGADVVFSAKEIWDSCEMIIKVKEPMPSEFPLLRRGQILYTYFHQAADKRLTEAVMESGCIGVAYETIFDETGGLPLLKPMSEIAGRLSVQEGAKYLEKPFGGRGVLLAGVPGVPHAKVVVLGAGIVGTNACKTAIGIGADVTVVDINLDRLRYLDDIYGSRLKTLYSTPSAIRDAVVDADLVIGAVLIPGGSTPKLLRREYLASMKPGSVVVDVAIDQGGCIETSRETYHDAPTFVVDGVLHYCVGNIPGAVPRTSTMALTNATLKYGLRIADMGIEAAAKADPGLMSGINVCLGKCTYEKVAVHHGIPYTPAF